MENSSGDSDKLIIYFSKEKHLFLCNGCFFFGAILILNRIYNQKAKEIRI